MCGVKTTTSFASQHSPLRTCKKVIRNVIACDSSFDPRSIRSDPIGRCPSRKLPIPKDHFGFPFLEGEACSSHRGGLCRIGTKIEHIGKHRKTLRRKTCYNKRGSSKTILYDNTCSNKSTIGKVFPEEKTGQVGCSSESHNLRSKRKFKKRFKV